MKVSMKVSKILFCLALLAGPMQFSQLARADDGNAQSCVLEGHYRLTLMGDERSGWLSGTIGEESIDWHVTFGRVSTWIGNQYLVLDLERDPYGGSYQLFGWVGSTFIRWRSIGTLFTGYQDCVNP